MISPSVPMPLPPHPETRKADGRGEPGARPRPGRPASPGGGILGRLMKPGHYRLRDQSRIIDSNGSVLAELENEGVLVAAHASDPLAVPAGPMFGGVPKTSGTTRRFPYAFGTRGARGSDDLGTVPVKVAKWSRSVAGQAMPCARIADMSGLVSASRPPIIACRSGCSVSTRTTCQPSPLS
jgi:hypothetical protein